MRVTTSPALSALPHANRDPACAAASTRRLTSLTRAPGRRLHTRASAMSQKSLTPEESRAVGSLLGCMCGDVLGSSVEGWDSSDIAKQFPAGLDDFMESSRGYGNYTDDTQMTIALARSLVSCGRVDPGHAAKAYAKEFDPMRGYGKSAAQILEDIRAGAQWDTVSSKYLPNGSYANGGAMRIAPVGIAYRNESEEVLHKAVKDALACTHVHPLAVDGAFIQASAVSLLFKMPLKNRVSATVPLELLDELMKLARTEEMTEKIGIVKEAYGKLTNMERPDPLLGWAAMVESDVWRLELETAKELGEGFQIKATDAVSCALLAMCFHWSKPQTAVMAAVHYGGDTDTIAALTGALVGALHGKQWIPARWWANLENGAAGRDELVRLATKLSNAQLSL